MRIRYGRALIGLTAMAAATATIALSGAGAAMASTSTVRPAVTSSCTGYCTDPLFNIEFGIQYFVNNANSRGVVGNNVNMQWASNNRPSQDWHVTFQYPVFVLYHLGFISAAMNLHYHFRPAFESMWTPYGVTSNLCRGVARTAYNGEMVTLQPCGDFPRTLWVVRNGYHRSGGSGGFELINGSSRNPSVPYVLTAGGGLFGGNPEAQLRVYQPVANNGVVNPGQLWCTASVSYFTFPPFSPNPNCFPNVRI